MLTDNFRLNSLYLKSTERFSIAKAAGVKFPEQLSVIPKTPKL
jgi:hypothetical protein